MPPSMLLISEMWIKITRLCSPGYQRLEMAWGCWDFCMLPGGLTWTRTWGDRFSNSDQCAREMGAPSPKTCMKVSTVALVIVVHPENSPRFRAEWMGEGTGAHSDGGTLPHDGKDCSSDVGHRGVSPAESWAALPAAH